jgi:hypothetical protein
MESHFVLLGCIGPEALGSRLWASPEASIARWIGDVHEDEAPKDALVGKAGGLEHRRR